MKRVAILSTGNELLYGKTIDTNSGFISSRLFPLDLRVGLFLVTGDNADDLERTIRYAMTESDIVIMTGGLGPTDDDMTIAVLQRIYGFSIVTDAPSRRRMEDFFRTIGMPMTDHDLKMTEVPAGSLVLANKKGLAPGFVIRHDDKVLIAMPGVPSEMTDMMDISVIPFLRDDCRIGEKSSFSFRVIGMKESDINASLRDIDIPIDRLEWGMTAREGIVTVTFVDTAGGGIDVESIAGGARTIFGERFLDPLWEFPEEEVLDILRKCRLTAAFAESCTGGLASKRITDIPGSSDVFMGAVVAYNNRVKTGQLGVSGEVLSRHGAVSPETASEMAAGVRSRLGSDIGISITGIAGPGGGSEAKPVGTVWFGLADAKGTVTFTRLITGDRDRVRSVASLIAIEYLRTYLKQKAVS